MFRGNHPAKVDEKGRLKLPSAFKQLMDAAHVTQLYITSTDGTKAEVWPLDVWEKQEARLMEASTMDEAVAKFLDQTSYYGQQMEIDGQARVVLPQILREKAKLDAEVVVLGRIDHLEVHNQIEFEQRLEASALTAEDRRAVAAILRGQVEAKNP
jgi:MraZ protein